jgi:hypothetical protein
VKIDRYLIVVLVLALAAIAFRPAIKPDAVRAQDLPRACGLQFEPGTTTIVAPGAERSVIGKVAYDTCNGKVWGFPTTTPSPYPVDSTSPNPPLSHPIYLERFVVEATQR